MKFPEITIDLLLLVMLFRGSSSRTHLLTGPIRPLPSPIQFKPADVSLLPKKSGSFSDLSLVVIPTPQIREMKLKDMSFVFVALDIDVIISIDSQNMVNRRIIPPATPL